MFFKSKMLSPGITGGFSFLILISAVLLLSLLVVNTASGWVESPVLLVEKDLGGRLVYSKYTHEKSGSFIVVRIKNSSDQWIVSPTINPGRITACGSVKELATGFSKSAMCSINASFFDESHYPIGTVAIDGDIVSLDNRKRTVLGIKTDGAGIIDLLQPRAFITADDYFEPVWIWGYNHPTRKDSILAYNYHFGQDRILLPADAKALVVAENEVVDVIESGYVPIEKKKTLLIFRGKSVSYLDRFKTGTGVTLGLVMPREWEKVSSMVTGGPRIIRDGRLVDLKKYSENLPSSIFKSHRRSIAGTTWNEEIFFAVFPREVTFETAAEILMELNVKDAMGLDGGSSTSLWVRDLDYINSSKKVPVALSILPGIKSELDPLPWFENKYWK
jgi:hypothetical protein